VIALMAAPGDRRDRALHREGGGDPDEHRSVAIPGGEHERGHEGLSGNSTSRTTPNASPNAVRKSISRH
jgi:hypothetical protein